MMPALPIGKASQVVYRHNGFRFIRVDAPLLAIDAARPPKYNASVFGA
jgi:hypothetical protein